MGWYVIGTLDEPNGSAVRVRSVTRDERQLPQKPFLLNVSMSAMSEKQQQQSKQRGVVLSRKRTLQSVSLDFDIARTQPRPSHSLGCRSARRYRVRQTLGKLLISTLVASILFTLKSSVIAITTVSYQHSEIKCNTQF